MSSRPTRLLVVFLFWEGDKERMSQVAKLAADLLTEPASDVGILFVSRKDSTPVDTPVLRHMEHKFGDVREWKCDRSGEGWPMGCNEMYLGTLAYAVNRKVGWMSNYDAMLFVESDCVFTQRDWHKPLIEAWDKMFRMSGGNKYVLGAEIPGGTMSNSHINAAAIYARDILNRQPLLISCNGNIGWDYFFGKIIIPVAENSSLFVLDYQRQTITEDQLFTPPPGRDAVPLFYHGVKDGSAIVAVRNHFKLDAVPAPPELTIEQFASAKGFSTVHNDDGTITLTPHKYES